MIIIIKKKKNLRKQHSPFHALLIVIHKVKSRSSSQQTDCAVREGGEKHYWLSTATGHHNTSCLRTQMTVNQLLKRVDERLEVLKHSFLA